MTLHRSWNFFPAVIALHHLFERNRKFPEFRPAQGAKHFPQSNTNSFFFIWNRGDEIRFV